VCAEQVSPHRIASRVQQKAGVPNSMVCLTPVRQLNTSRCPLRDLAITQGNT
jgi:hypothetical protein